MTPPYKPLRLSTNSRLMYSMPRMLVRLVLCIGSLAHISLQETKTCYACASESLSSRWHITGLPRVQDSLFGDCSSQSVAKMRVESCSGSCFTYMFEDPDVTPSRCYLSLSL
ncbi:hypothetical protein ANCCAN_26999 [Ancylostoma caninum]|uniref:Uncharacterized protein n=1 Tax=Ancylostoma caninum TaxID=29170 RepID=A0A368F6Q7_ANCCA|nr:hypothetical protein ANCCAN_26999 [Ancylostoma caninum]